MRPPPCRLCSPALTAGGPLGPCRTDRRYDIMSEIATRTSTASTAALPVGERIDPRALMAARLPATVQPFLTWLTARPAPAEADRERPGWTYLSEALLWVAAGLVLGALACRADPSAAWLLLPASLVATTSGLG